MWATSDFVFFCCLCKRNHEWYKESHHRTRAFRQCLGVRTSTNREDNEKVALTTSSKDSAKAPLQNRHCWDRNITLYNTQHKIYAKPERHQPQDGNAIWSRNLLPGHHQSRLAHDRAELISFMRIRCTCKAWVVCCKTCEKCKRVLQLCGEQRVASI